MIQNFDESVLIYIQENLRNEVLNPVFKFITSLGDAGWCWIVLAVILLCFKKTRKTALVVAGALILSLIINNIILKNLVARPRPFAEMEDLILLISKPHDYSFPSGHTGSSFAAAYALWKTTPRKYGILAMVLAGLIAFSRLYLGVHYPTDVLGGIITGIIAGLISYIVVSKLWDKKWTAEIEDTL